MVHMTAITACPLSGDMAVDVAGSSRMMGADEEAIVYAPSECWNERTLRFPFKRSSPCRGCGVLICSTANIGGLGQ